MGCQKVVAAAVGFPFASRSHILPAMKPKSLGMLLLSIYLILIGVIGAAGVSLGHLQIVVPILAIAAGVCLLIGK
jgi:hypothetical protein